MGTLVSYRANPPGPGAPAALKSLVSRGALALSLWLVLALFLAACDQPTAKKPAATAQPSDALPAFADWRAAYIDSAAGVHAVTLDGKTDVTGLSLPDLTAPDLNFPAGGKISPDGHLVAYASPFLDIVDLTGRHGALRDTRALAYGFSWSPDSKQVAVDEGNGAIVVISATDGIVHPIQGMPPGVVGYLIGWLDGTNLAIEDAQNPGLVTLPNGDQYPTSIGFASLDIVTGQVREIARITSQGLSEYQFILSPDSSKVLFTNFESPRFPYTPLVDEIDVASGTVTPLPAIDKLTGSGFLKVAWKPGTNLVAVSTGFLVDNNLKNWLLGMGHDQAVPLPDTGFVGEWVPDNNMLVLTTGQDTGTGRGPFTLTAMTLGTDGQVVSSTTLTQSAMTFPFLGFVRTA